MSISFSSCCLWQQPHSLTHGSCSRDVQYNAVLFPVLHRRFSCCHGCHFAEHSCRKRWHSESCQWGIVRPIFPFFHLVLLLWFVLLRLGVIYRESFVSKLLLWYMMLFYFTFILFLFYLYFFLDVSCWMSSDSNLIWIFVAFLVMIEVVSDTNVTSIKILLWHDNQLLNTKLKSTFHIALKLFYWWIKNFRFPVFVTLCLHACLFIFFFLVKKGKNRNKILKLIKPLV